MSGFFLFSPFQIRPMKSLVVSFILMFSFCSLNAQKFEVLTGDLMVVSDAKKFNVEFEYASDLKVKNKKEETYIKQRADRKEKLEKGSGVEFIQLWYKNRSGQYEPTLIQQFNSFSLDDSQVRTSRNFKTSKYTMLIKTNDIDPGYANIFYVQASKIEFDVLFYETENPENILCRLKTKIRGGAMADELERIRSVYGNLGLALSKRINRKSLASK